MSDHDFEKRVKQKMDELKFTPSDAVWQAVQLKIRKDRPRRRGWVLIPVLLAGLGVAGYFISDNLNKSDSEISYQSSNSNKSIPELSGNSSAPDDSSAPGNSSAPNTLSAPNTSLAPENSSEAGNSSIPGSSSPSQNSAATEEPDFSDKEKSNDLHVNSLSLKKAGKDNPATDRPGSIVTGSTTADKKPAPEKNSQDGKVPVIKNKGSKANQTILQPQQQSSDSRGQTKYKPETGTRATMGLTLQTQPPVQTQAQNKQGLPSIQNHDSTAQTAIVADQHQITQQDSALAVKPVIKSDLKNDSSGAQISDLVKSRKKKTAWDWGLSVAGGISNINEGPLTGLLKSSHMADAASSPQSSNNFLFAPSTAGLPPAKPSEVIAGPSFSIGGFVSKQLSKRFSISAALQYSQFNTIIKVGYLVDSSRLVNNGSQVRNVARYYRADDNSKFSNKYHFIELPLTLHTRITGSKSLPLFWNAGVHLSQMIGSNALVFDSGTGVYYKDKSTLNKTQVGFATGFTVGLFGKSKTPMLIGPFVKYNASEMFKKDILSGKHLVSAGLDFRILLNKK